MPVPSSISDLSTTPSLNSPAGTESPSTVDDYLRTQAAFIKQVDDKTTGAVKATDLAATGGSALVGFQQAGTGAVARTGQDKLRETVSVKDFGAVGDGVTDDTAAIMAAINSVSQIGVTASIGAASKKAVHFPAGIYRVASSLNSSNYATLIGERAVIKADAGVTALIVPGYQVTLSGLTFVGGATGIGIATNNADTCTIHIQECEFLDQASSAIESDTNSASTILVVERCRFYNANSGATLVKAQCLDKLVVSDVWATCAGVGVQVGSAVKMCNASIYNWMGVPQGGTTVWIKNYGAVSVKGGRFGGESAAIIVQNYGAVDATLSNIKHVCIEDSEVYCGGSYAVEFYQVPNNFVWRNNRGLVNSHGFYFDSGVSSLTSLSTLIGKWIVEDQSGEYLFVEGSTEPTARAMAMGRETVRGAGSLAVTDKMLQIIQDGGGVFGLSLGYGGAAANVSVTAFTHTFGAQVRGWSGDGASYNGSVAEGWDTALNGFASGWYTAVFDVEVAGSMPASTQLGAADLSVQKILPPGKQIVCVPFYFNASTSSKRVFYNASRLNNAKSIGFGPIRIFSGVVNVDSQNNILYGAAAPATLQWEKGDRVINSSPTVGQPKAWVCTVAGAPGTWASEGNL